MIRQNILRGLAIDRAIELFLNEPFDGEMQDGDLLALLVSCGTAAYCLKKIYLFSNKRYRKKPCNILIKSKQFYEKNVVICASNEQLQSFKMY